MKYAYKDGNMQTRSLKVIERANQFIAEYAEQNIQLTLRQLYYRFVGLGLIKNELKEYKKLGHTLSEGRLHGLIDWDAIVDRTRGPTRHPQRKGPADAIDEMLQEYRRARRDDQDVYVELWCEKDAIAGVLEPIADKYHVITSSNRGYSSQTAMRDAAHRFMWAQHKKKTLVLFYIGDHDPSGEDMVRDIESRFFMFGVEVPVTKLTLTIEQVRQFKLFPNPVKMTDSRNKDYRRKFGNQCWETDALPPKFLHDTADAALKSVTNMKKMAAVIRREEKDKRKIKKACGKILKGLKRERGEK